MSMELRYAGEFLSKGGTAWRCEILQEADLPFDEVGELAFPAGEPLILEWPERSKEEPLCGSTATLTVISPGDRTYADLYTVKPGTIRLDVYRAGVLYWSGCLDPEFYEEPYDRGSGYDVTLTFSDFGILDRIRCGLEGMPTLESYFQEALSASGLNYVRIRRLISTQFPDGSPLELEDIKVRSDNFIDEDGNGSSWAEVLSGILQPLALRMVQSEGEIVLYDLNAAAGEDPDEIEWDGTGSSMGTDRVYNRIVVTFSPYGDKNLSTGDMEYTDTHGPEWTNLGIYKSDVLYNGQPPEDPNEAPECYSFYPDYGEGHDSENIDFTAFVSKEAASDVTKSSFPWWFRMEPVLGGSEAEGVAWGFRVGHASSRDGGVGTRVIGQDPGGHQQLDVVTTRRVWLPPFRSTGTGRRWLRLRLEMMCDFRYNPFSESSENNDGDIQEAMTQVANLLIVPVSLTLYDSETGGSAVGHWTNREITVYGRDAERYSDLTGAWEDGASEFGDAWLMYCDPSSTDSLMTGSGIGGWKCNRQNFGIADILGWAKTHGSGWKLSESFGRMLDGQFIEYPENGGWLELKVMSGVYAYSVNPELISVLGGKSDTFNMTISQTACGRVGMYDHIRWLLYKIPELSVVKGWTGNEDDGDGDVEFSGVLNPDARDDLSIDTICGTLDSPSPAAKGAYVQASDGMQLRELRRAGVTDRPEQLLIGTLYSQYAERMTTLTGVVRTGHGQPKTFTDAAQEDSVKFIALSERQDCISDSSEVKFCELRPDEYEGKV